MRVTIFAVGRMKPGPETDLVSRYLDRFAKSGRSLGLDYGGLVETPESRARSAESRKSEEGARCADTLDSRSILVLLDERGKSPSSREFAQTVERFRDDGVGQLVFALGGPDGHAASLRDRANWVVSLGNQTWPHQLARIMLAEQLYRAATILAGHPYHRD
ncbi:23S rRNA (pseudouridine(1915)-N(3))-methyltransferase RlmH [Oricola sp.]|uniref:23S rRNA (pseudouridine(1915)-N(3))-methyltransferase RlmH n=1 Tax=Oricola sp. TaxID=1979950 RepID=UPI003BA93DE6